jgi:hypothetical protein
MKLNVQISMEERISQAMYYNVTLRLVRGAIVIVGKQ